MTVSVPAAPLAPNEWGRLAALGTHHILDTEPEDVFDDAVHLAALICGTPIALVSLVDAERQWFKAGIGLDVSETARNVAFCARAMLAEDVFIVADASADERFSTNELVTAGPRVRFYAGAPLRTELGQPLGALCVIDNRPRQLTPDQVAALRALARQVEHRLIERRSSAVNTVLRRVSAAANSSSDIADAVQVALDAVCAHTGWPVGHAFLAADDASGDMVASGLWHVDDSDRYRRFCDATNTTRLAPGTGLIGSVAAVGQPMWLPDLSTEPSFERWNPHNGLRCAFASPVMVGDEVVGVLEFLASEPQPPDPTLLAVMAEIGVQLGRVAERSRAARALRSSEDRIRRILDTANDAYVGLAADGTICEWNARAEAMFGWSQAEAIGLGVTETIIPPRYRRAHLDGISHLLATGEGPVLDRAVEVTALHRDGHEIPVELTVWAVRTGGIYAFNAFIKDVTEREKTAERVRALDERFRRSFDDAPIGMVMTGLDGRLLEVNRALCAFLGYTEGELLARTCADVTHPDDRAMWDRATELVIDGGVSAHSEELRYVDANGQDMWVSVTVSVLRDHHGQPMQLVAMVEDIGHRRAASTALRAAFDREEDMVRQLRDLDVAKTDFVSNVSHELRTPLTSIAGYCEMLGDGDGGELSAEQARMLEIIERNTRRLLALIEDLLALSRVESGSIKVSLVPTELRPVIEAAAQVTLPSAASGGLHVELDVSADLGIVLADPGQLDRAFLNLLSNAIKFTPAGGRVAMSAHRHGDEAVVVVTDTGIGIPEQDHKRLFTRFFRSSLATDRAIQGTGLGLAIVDSIVSRHGGTITIDSVQGEGTTVTVRLPLVGIAVGDNVLAPAASSAGAGASSVGAAGATSVGAGDLAGSTSSSVGGRS